MIGAIIGDIVGSVYEWNWIKTKSFDFFNDQGFITDDSVCTAAVADALLHDRAPAAALQDWCRRYPNASYGGSFRSWIWMDPPRPYNSFGNGAAMRVSPAAYLNRDSLSAALEASDLVTAVTHNHPEGLKGARATVHAIWLAYQGESPNGIRKAVTDTYGYDLSRTVDEIRPTYTFNEICQTTVPRSPNLRPRVRQLRRRNPKRRFPRRRLRHPRRHRRPPCRSAPRHPGRYSVRGRNALYPRGHPGHRPRDVRNHWELVLTVSRSSSGTLCRHAPFRLAAD